MEVVRDTLFYNVRENSSNILRPQEKKNWKSVEAPWFRASYEWHSSSQNYWVLLCELRVSFIEAAKTWTRMSSEWRRVHVEWVYNFDKNNIKIARRECPQRGSANTHFHAGKKKQQ